MPSASSMSRYTRWPSAIEALPVMASAQEHLWRGAVNRSLPPLGKMAATFASNLRWTSASIRNKRPQATTPSKVRPKRFESSTAAHSTETVGKLARKAAIILGEASTPYTLNPRSIKACEIGMPVPQPKSRTAAPSGSILDQSATTEAPIPDCWRPRSDMKLDATSS
jgi:hypothetical protein